MKFGYYTFLLLLVLSQFSCKQNKRKLETAWKTVVWLDTKENESYQSIHIDSLYFSEIDSVSKAAMGYVVTFVGNECWWANDDETAIEERSNLKCTILNALDLGCQCSDRHLTYLRKWFQYDEKVLKELEDCPTIPYTSTIQTTIKELRILRLPTEIVIKTKEAQINTREDYYQEYSKNYLFSYINNQLLLKKIY